MSEDLKKYFEWLASQQPKVPEGYTHYGPNNAGVTLPSGTDFMDSMYKGGWQSSVPGVNPYFPNGASNGSLSLGGSPTESGVSADPKSQAPSTPGQPTNDQLKAFLEYLAGRAGNASPIVGQAQVQAAYTPRPGGPQYGAVTQKGLL